MNLYRVRLTRLVEQETSIDCLASSVEAAAAYAIKQVDDGGLYWHDSRYEPSSHAVDDIVRLPDPPELMLSPAATRIGQFEAGALAREQRKQRE
jgi:hypothetical protein